MGGDEFAAVLVETGEGAAGHFLARLVDGIDELAAKGELPQGFSISPGVAHYPTEAPDADTLYRLADERLYETRAERGVGR
jgi:GGDEF domain-containing protein